MFRMLKTLAALLAFVTVPTSVGLLAVGCGAETEAATPAALPTVDATIAAAARAAQIEKGKYLVMVGGCNDCHTPWVVGPDGMPGPDPTRLLSGHPQDIVVTEQPPANGDPWSWQAASTNTAFSGPWGVSFTANLTPDVNTGTGTWTEDLFIKTLRTGRHWGQSRPILPPMPWFNYGKMTEDDLKAIFAYLHSLPPVHNRVPEPLPPSAVVAAEAAGAVPADVPATAPASG